MTWKIQAGQDSDVVNYIAAVETADGQSLESGVKLAYHNFIIGCKADGIWNAIKASCILAGARTLSGALVPLKGTAPTNFNFVAGDYNRETGLVGDGSTKYLDSNRNDNADPQNNRHLSVFRTAAGATAGCLIGSVETTGSFNKSTFIDFYNYWRFAAASFGINVGGYAFTTLNFFGVSRSNSASITYRINGASGAASDTSVGVINQNYYVFNRNATSNYFSRDRLSFYSIGESIDLVLLDARVTQLMTDIGAAIP